MQGRNIRHLAKVCYYSKLSQSSEPLGERKTYSHLECQLKMAGWQIHNYGNTEELQFTTGLRVPQIRRTSDCLVRVYATTVNPIDVAMLGGYGSKILNKLRCKISNEIEFPLILGREFCGEVIQCGMAVNKNASLGDRVWGVVPLEKMDRTPNTLLYQIIISPAPKSLSNEQVASVLYAGLTAWSGLYITGRIAGFCHSLSRAGGRASKRILVIGGSGSVGSLAIQILKSQNATVFATCSKDALELVKNLGADFVVDYKNAEEVESLHRHAPFDIVLDCAGQGTEHATQIKFQFRQYITFSSPLVRNIDNFGVGLGMIKNITDLVESNSKTLSAKGGTIKWGFFTPAPQGMEMLSNLVERKKLLPLIDSSFTFEQLPQAYEKVQRGHLRGKVVITMS